MENIAFVRASLAQQRLASRNMSRLSIYDQESIVVMLRDVLNTTTEELNSSTTSISCIENAQTSRLLGMRSCADAGMKFANHQRNPAVPFANRISQVLILGQIE
ncbi:unnamed protein product [Aspergillus oryzae]|nr:unnamed protein product [Aspergillus oryzae]GMF96258.1 unnamed protein product [Aspergillus oryzae]GMG01953.1 unnamed protein product [Aspergillus oryzae]